VTTGDAFIQSVLNWELAHQGDIVEFEGLAYMDPNLRNSVQFFSTPDGIALVSQTCDLLRGESREWVLVAPIVSSNEEELIGAAQKGKKPLLVSMGRHLDKFADIERMTSISRIALRGAKVLDRTCDTPSGKQASELASRIARGLSRFAFPNEVHDSLRQLQDKVVEAYQKQTKFAEVLRLVDDIRIGCPDWGSANKELSVYVIVPAESLQPVGVVPNNWAWSPETVAGIRAGMKPESLSIEQLSNFILINTSSKNDAALIVLWNSWGELVERSWLSTKTEGVASIELFVVSSAEFTYEQYTATEALDFATLSHGSDG